MNRKNSNNSNFSGGSMG